MNRAALEFRDVAIGFGGVAVLPGLSFSVLKAERVALIGPNGAGKTTAFNVISGLHRPDAGTVLVDGQDITDLPSRQRIRAGVARSFQNLRLIPDLSVLENVMVAQHALLRGWKDWGLPMHSGKRHTLRQEAIEILEDAGLRQYMHGRVQSLPYGVAKRVDVVRALVTKPRLLLLDEPAAGLNPQETKELAKDLMSISATGVTLIVVEHDMSFVSAVCQRAIVLNFGKKIADGALDGVRTNRDVRAAYLGEVSYEAA